MKDAEALEQIDQTTAAAAQGNEAETARNGQVGQTDYAQQSMTQLFPNGLHGEKGRRSGVVQIMLDTLGAAELHFDVQRPQRKALGRQSALDDIERARARLADYERNQGQIGRAHPVAAQRAIAGGSHEHQLVLHESLVAKRRTGGLSLDQADIDPLVGDQTLDPLRVTVGHGHADVGIAFPETRQYGREHVLRQRRTRAEGYLSAGRVTVNGSRAALGDRADPETDAVTLDGQPLSREPERVYLMLNKPRGYVTTLSDERGRRTAAELVSGCGARVYPVGRLDMDSEGLLLMTNDGAWMQRLLHPSREIEKEYRVTVTGPVEGAAGRLAAIRDLEGERIRPARVRELWRDGNKAALSVTIHEGKNRQMCRQAGLAVWRLQRVREHTLTLGDLPVGRWRYLTQQELQMLEGSEKR